VAEVRHGNDDILAVYKIADVYLVVVHAQFGAAGRIVLILYLEQLGADDIQHARRRGEDVFEVRDPLFELGKRVFELLDFERSETREAHIEYGVRLLIREIELRHELFARLVAVTAALDDLYDAVDVRERFDETFEDML